MIDERNTLNITGGTDVFGADGGKVGSVSGVEGDYVVVSKGFFFPTDYYIPASAINTANEDGVYLNVSKDEALHQGWDAIPATNGTAGTDGAYTDQELTGRAATDTWNTGKGTSATGHDTGAAGTYDATRDESLVDKAKDTLTGTGTGQTNLDDNGTIRMPLAEEELTARTRDVDRGAVHVDKVVTEEQQTLDVPVSEDRVHVSRRVVDRDVDPGETSFQEGTIEVPVHGEEVVVDKRARVREELEITKDRVQNTKHVTDTVRREEARLRDGEGVIEGTESTATANNGKGRSRSKAKNK
jgi:uncharacterized protein (TIGR02271 family)